MFTRRTFTGRIPWVIAIVSGLGRITFAYPEETSQEVAFRWRVPIAQSTIVKNTLKFRGEIKTEHDKKGLPLILIFIEVSLLPSLVDAILTLRRKLVEPGLKIDTRGDSIKIEIDPDLPRAMILLVEESGAKIYQPDQLSAPAELLKVLADAKGK